MSDTVWSRVSHRTTQAAAGSAAAMSAGMLTLAAKDLKEGLDNNGWGVVASANSLLNFNLTGDCWTTWEGMVNNECWTILSSPESFSVGKDLKGTPVSNTVYMLLYITSSYYLNVVFSLSPFILSNGSLPSWGKDSWGHIYTANTADMKYSPEGYTAVPSTGLEFTNDLYVNSEGGFIFTHRANSVASNYSDKSLPRVVVAAMSVENPRPGDYCPVVSFRSCGDAAVALGSSISTNSLHLMDGSSSHKWRGIFWDGYSWKQTRISILGLGYSYFSSGAVTPSLISGPNVYPATSSNKVFAYKANTLSCSPGVRFYRGSLPDIYVTPSSFDEDLDSSEFGVERLSLNNLSVLSNTTNHITINPEVRLFNTLTPAKPGYITSSTSSATLSVVAAPVTGDTTASVASPQQEISAPIIDTDQVLKAQRALKEAQAVLEAAKMAGVSIDTTDLDILNSAQETLEEPPPGKPGVPVVAPLSNVTYPVSIYGTPNFTITGTNTLDSAKSRYYELSGVYINPKSKAYICLNSDSNTTAARYRPNTTNIIELPGAVGLDTDILGDESSYIQAIKTYWADSNSSLPNPSEQSDFIFTYLFEPGFSIVIENVSSKTSPLQMSLLIDTSSDSSSVVFID